MSDQIDGYIPALHEIAQRLGGGDFASWSNLVGGGSPLLSSPDFAVFTPGRWLFLVLPTWLAPGWSKLVELAFAAIFSYLLVRRLNGSKLAAALAGFVYPLTGFMIGWNNWPQVAVGSAIPMIFWSIERFVQERRLRASIPIALASAVLLFGGFPAVAGQTLYVAAGYALVRLISLHRTRIRVLVRDAVVIAVAVGVGVGLTAVQLLPFTHQVLGTADLSYRGRGFFSATPLRYVLTSVFPQSFTGNSLPVNFGSPMDLNAYVGSVVLLLAVLGAFCALTGLVGRGVGVYLVAVVLLVIGLIWFQGTWSDWMDHLPVLHGNPIGRARSQLGIPAAVLAAAGFDMIRGVTWSRPWTGAKLVEYRWAIPLAAACVCALVCAVGIRVATGPYIGLAPSRWPDVVLAGLPLIVVTVLLTAGVWIAAARSAALVVAIVSMAAQAVAATAFYWPTAPRSEFYPSTSGIAYLQQHVGTDRMATLGYTMRPNITAFYGLRTLNGHSFFPKPMQSLLKAIYPGAFVGATYSILSTQPDPWLESTGLDRLGVHYLVGDADAPLPGTHQSPVPIPGDTDELPAAGGTLALTPGRTYEVPVAASPLRGVSVPLTLREITRVSAILRGPDGSTIAQNSVQVDPGTWNVPVPLAAEPVGSTPGVEPTRKFTVEITVDQPGVQGTSDPGGNLRLQPVRSPEKSDSARLAYASDGLVIWERLDYVPRIHWAGRATVIKDDATRRNAVAQSPLDPGDVILADDPPGPLSSADVPPTQFNVLEDTGDTVRVHVQVRAPGYVVVSDNIQSDFLATVDGHGAPIVDADYAVGAVYVSAGAHDIELHYHPRGRAVGAAISLGSAVMLLLVALPTAGWAWLRPRRRRAQVS